jgi:ATP-dependent helicase/nuclease subunit B
MHALVAAHRAEQRQRIAAAWVAERPSDAQVLVIAPTLEAGSRILRRAAEGRPAAFGWQRATPSELAARLAAAGLAAKGRTQVASVVLEAVCARVVHRLRDEGALGRYTRVGTKPGLPRAFARTFGELALADVREGLPDDLGRVYAAYRRELASAGLADRSDVLRAAIDRVSDRAPHPLLDLPIVLLDVPVASALDAELVRALASRSLVRAVVPSGDATALRRLSDVLSLTSPPPPSPLLHAGGGDSAETANALSRLNRQLFSSIEASAPIDGTVEIFSAPGESRECVEIARRALEAARDGVAFDRIAVLAHAPDRYRAHLVEAFRRANLPAHFSRGVKRPDPQGRALLALLACKAERLSARAFAEYLSLGVVPEPDQGEIEWLPPDDDAEEEDWFAPLEPPIDAEAAVVQGTLQAPWRWERLIVDAAVIEKKERWARRLSGLANGLTARRRALEDPDDPIGARIDRDLRDLEHLASFALPLLEELDALPARASWGEWAERLDALARRAIRRPERVLAVLRELAPMGPIGPVGLTEVELVLGRRLSEMTSPPHGSPAGKIYVASIEEARGMSFDLVFVPGLAERVFPRKVTEDPIALDAVRAKIPELATTTERVERERLALSIAIGAAEQRLVFSYPRLDTERSRPRVPSFYGLEVLRAIEGALGSFEELAARAEEAGGARMAWPAPSEAERAIDGAEYDLAVLEEVLSLPIGKARGAVRYLVSANPHLARALRARFSRWDEKWTRADGLVNPEERTKALLLEHHPRARAYSATALEQLAACPYRFYLRSIVGLTPNDPPEAIDELDPRERGSLIHAAQAEVLSMLRAEGMLPITDLPAARVVLDRALSVVTARFEEELAPAIERVWRDAIEEVRVDLSEWLARLGSSWTPTAFELAFGLSDEGHDPASVREPIVLSEGLTIRGAIDLVESRDGALRATDHKTGNAGPFTKCIGGGRVLQPVLYARALEAMFPDRSVVGGRLYYCTAKGRFEERFVPLDDEARDAIALVAKTLGAYIEQGFLPAAPSEGECAKCDYRAVCGPAEERRSARKHAQMLGPLKLLRKRA